MFSEKIPAVFMRGGTSKALIFHRKDLPEQANWDNLFLSLMGSPDPYMRQLNGMGGGVSSLSKVAIIEKSAHPHADVDYTFGQVIINEAKVDYGGNCGNISAAVGPFAISEGLIEPVEGENIVRIFNTNTKKIIHGVFEVRNGKPVTTGDLEIPGVAGTAAPIRLDFLEPGGATTGKLLPTGNVCDELDIPSIGKIQVSMVDAANACIFVNAHDLGLRGDELPSELNQMPEMLVLLNTVRTMASCKMGIGRSLEHAATIKTVPYICFVSPSKDAKTLSETMVQANQIDFTARAMSNGQPHLALPLTLSLCLGVAANITGSVVHQIAKLSPTGEQNKVRIGMPSGVLTVGAQVQQIDGQWIAYKGSFYRTARKLFEGFVYSFG